MTSHPVETYPGPGLVSETPTWLTRGTYQTLMSVGVLVCAFLILYIAVIRDVMMMMTWWCVSVLSTWG